ncbi:S8 family serine peptidase [Hymenobacter arizonensis]|uniref:Por secretion system C-terminal sorting domain-containing protein n=1 Tax=Hymenobacter arizonensis TaxID=1227077 RepID=A0A1I6BGY6_HYMAR|nr:S8 family serine peptidase [Hymenobacter arizonensis]SFQ80210.1 Por secretion system C-terminal sorting domain-containing protein [Hymenobacter arizonensis]
MSSSTRLIRGIFLFFFLPTATCFAQEYASYHKGKKVYYEPSTSQVLVKFKDAATLARREKAAPMLGSNAMRSLAALPGVSLLDIAPGKTKASIRDLVTQYLADPDVTQAAPILLDEKGKPFGAVNDQFIVKLKPSTSTSGLHQLLAQTGTAIDHQSDFDAKTYYLKVDKKKGDAMTLANRFHESGLFEYSEPNFVLFIEKTTNDPFYAQQYALNNTGQMGGFNDADMDVAEAWGITTGDNTIRIAVLDDGVELNHPDLRSNLLAGFDATGQGTGGAPTQNDSHGTACAGIVGAQANNGIGIAGVAYSSRIVPVRVFTGTSTIFDITTAEWMASGIDWAWQNNRADVLSLSFRVSVGQQAVIDALNRAVTQGRNGLGCIVLAATGNQDSPLDFPASEPSVIAVGATTHRDQRANFSNFGTGLDLVAPGENIYTSDRQGTAGYSTTDYLSNFTGTSAACPNAAGVAALILSVNPSLTQLQARQILESSADKTGGYTYIPGTGENTSLSWNSEMGYGRVNAYKATLQALCTNPSPISGNWHSSTNPYNQTTPLQTSQTVPSGNVTVQVGAKPSVGTTYSFSAQRILFNSPPPTVYQSSPGSNVATFAIGPSGTANERVYLDVTATNPDACSSTTTTFYFFVIRNYYMVSSNPTSSDVILQNTDPNTSPQIVTSSSPATNADVPNDELFEACLYNSYGKLVKTGKSQKGRVKFDVRDLPEGFYILRAGSGKQTYTEHVQIAH